MEARRRSMRMRLQSLSPRGFALTLVVAGVAFALCVVAGALGPTVWLHHSHSAWSCVNSSVFEASQCSGVDIEEGQPFAACVGPLDRLNMELQLVARFSHALPESMDTLEKEVFFNVSVRGKSHNSTTYDALETSDVHARRVVCSEEYRYCTNITLAHFNFLEFSDYCFEVALLPDAELALYFRDVDFTFRYINAWYTLYEMLWRFVFLVATIIFTFIFQYRMRKFSWTEWTVEQKWAVAILFGLVAYNNPFFTLMILWPGTFPVFLDSLLTGGFLWLLLLFWLIMFDGVRNYESSERSFVRFYLPKLVLTGVVFIAAVVVFTWTEVHQLDDPAYNTLNDVKGFVVFEVFMLLALVIYTFWLIFSICRAVGDTKVMPFLGMRLKFFGVFTLVVILLTVGGLVFGAVGPDEAYASQFLTFFALFNLYVYVLAFVYAPAPGGSVVKLAERGRMIRLDALNDDLSIGRASELSARPSRANTRDDDGTDDDVAVFDMDELDATESIPLD